MIAKNRIIFDHSKLRGLIIEKFERYCDFAEAVGLSPQVLSLKLNGTMALTRYDIYLWAKTLDIKSDDFGSLFFTPKV